MWIDRKVVHDALKGLREMEPTPKRGKERTSCLMYFLAFNKLVARGSTEPILLDPETGPGRQNRREYTKEYAKLVSVGTTENGKELWVDNLGDVNFSGKRQSANKFSADFLTVPLKRASTAKSPQGHPRRPSPLLTLGVTVYGLKWGAEMHPEWKSNLPDFLNDRLSPTKWTNLAIFVFRKEPMDPKKSLVRNLEDLIKQQFTKQLSMLWCSMIKAEKRRLNHPNKVFAKTLENPFPEPKTNNQMSGGEQLPTAQEWEQILEELAHLREENAILRRRLENINEYSSKGKV